MEAIILHSLAVRPVTKRNSFHFGLELVVSLSKPFKATCLHQLRAAHLFIISYACQCLVVGWSYVKVLTAWLCWWPFLSHHAHTFSAFWLWSSVVSVLISVTTDMSPTGDLLVTSIFAGEVSSWACSGAFTCCAGMALGQWQHTLWGNRLKKERKQNNYLHTLGI